MVDKELVDAWMGKCPERLVWWLDLMGMAGAGLEVRSSVARLSARWKVSAKVVRGFLDFLRETGRVTWETDHHDTVFRLVPMVCVDECQGQTKGEQRANKGQTKGKLNGSESESYVVDMANRGQTEGKQRASKGQTYNIDIDINKYNITPTPPAGARTCERTDDPDIPEKPDSPEKPWSGLREFFNRTMNEAGARIPRVKAVTDRRLTAVMARAREYGDEAVYEVITRAARSPFLNGGGNKVFVADFDWIFRPNNFPKVLEGNYDEIFINNPNKSKNSNHDTDGWTGGPRDTDGDSGFAQRRAEAGALVARLLAES